MLKTICRLLLGAVFVFSGFAKAVDPVGGAIKLQEYIALVGITNADTLALLAAIVLSSLEFVIGFMLLFKMKAEKAAFPALVFMVFFTILTLYIAIAEPVTDCGCFGDAIKLSNWGTFYKNLILLPASVLVYANRKSITNQLSGVMQMTGALVGLVFIVGISLYGLRNLPMLDFRPFKVGQNIEQGMSIPEGAPQAEYSTTFILEKEGVKKEFSVDNYPYEDSTWVYVETITKVLKEGYQPPITNFALFDEEGMDATWTVLHEDKPVFLLTAPKIEKASLSSLEKIKTIRGMSMGLGYPFYVVTSSGLEDCYRFDSEHGLGFSYLMADETMIKTMSRGNPGLMILKEGTIYAKYSHLNLPSADELRQPITHSIKALKAKKDLNLLIAWSLLLTTLVFVLYKFK